MKLDPLTDWQRTHTCGELRAADAGKTVRLLGWVQRRRDLGQLIFLDLRDRYGLTQIVLRQDTHPGVHARGGEVRPEFVVAVEGAVARREKANPNLPTGEIEVVASRLDILNDARTPPFPIEEEVTASEETRLRHRYLDLRRPPLQRNLALRHRVALALRSALDAESFYEIETPFLTRSTPEGARDYLVPSRVHPGHFYALPQSPQIFKQLLMIAGFDRYFQIVRCFRDEDLRADRQPEFTQLDLEVAFATRDAVFAVIERAMAAACEAAIGVKIVPPFPRLTHAEALARYGSDKPDTRFAMELRDVSPVFESARETLKIALPVHALTAPGAASFSRKQLDALAEFAKQQGARALYHVKVTDSGLQSPLEKTLGAASLEKLRELTAARAGDLILIVPSDEPAAAGLPSEALAKAGQPHGTASTALGALRLHLARELKLMSQGKWNFLWVTDFPLFEWSASENRWVSSHHPFTAPVEEDLDKLETQQGRVRSQAYDLVLNGWELGSGSIRIHRQDIQQRIFRVLGLSDEEAKERFGFFLDALTYGTPPHGGIALGLDRIAALLAGSESLREVIAFPKTTTAQDLMADAPSPIEAPQEEELELLSAYHLLDKTCWQLAEYADCLVRLIEGEVFGEGIGGQALRGESPFQQAMALILAKSRDDARGAIRLAKAGYGVQSAAICRSIVESAINARYIAKDQDNRARSFLLSVAEETRRLGDRLGRHATDGEHRDLIMQAQEIETSSGWPRNVSVRAYDVEKPNYTYDVVFFLLSQIVHSSVSSLAGKVSQQTEENLTIGYGKSSRWVTTALATASIFLYEIANQAYDAFGLDKERLERFAREFNEFHQRQSVEP